MASCVWQEQVQFSRPGGEATLISLMVPVLFSGTLVGKWVTMLWQWRRSPLKALQTGSLLLLAFRMWKEASTYLLFHIMESSAQAFPLWWSYHSGLHPMSRWSSLPHLSSTPRWQHEDRSSLNTLSPCLFPQGNLFLGERRGSFILSCFLTLSHVLLPGT